MHRRPGAERHLAVVAEAEEGRVFTQGGRGALSFDLDATFLRQDPASPSPRTGRVLSPRVPVDGNQNPPGATIAAPHASTVRRRPRWYIAAG